MGDELPCSDLRDDPDFLDRLPLQDQVENQKLAAAIAAIGEKDYQILYLKVVEELSYQQIADRLHMNFWTVKSSYLRVIRGLRKIK